MTYQIITIEEAATIVGLPTTVVSFYAEVGLIGSLSSTGGYTEEHLRELRRARRLMQDLDLSPEAVEVVLRMRQRILALEQEVCQLRTEAQAARLRQQAPNTWFEADWREGW
jgi:DNA-binding transcriptional MerR regulator